MPYEEDLPSLFAELPNLVVAGYASPMDLATIWSTGKLPEPPQLGPTLADLEGQFEGQFRGDTFTDVLLNTGDPNQANIIARTQATEAINDAVNQTMINNLAKDENKVSLAADAVVGYGGPMDPGMDIANIVAPSYGVSSDKVEAELKDRGRRIMGRDRPFWESGEDQAVAVQPEVIDPYMPISITPMAGDPGFNQAIDQGLPPIDVAGFMPQTDVAGMEPAPPTLPPGGGPGMEPAPPGFGSLGPITDEGGLSAPPASEYVPWRLLEQKRAWDPTLKRGWEAFYDEVYPDVEMPGSPWAEAASKLGSAIEGAIYDDWSEISEGQRQHIIENQRYDLAAGETVHPYKGQPTETIPTGPLGPIEDEGGISAAPVQAITGDVPGIQPGINPVAKIRDVLGWPLRPSTEDDPGIQTSKVAQRAANDITITGQLDFLHDIFGNTTAYQYNPDIKMAGPGGVAQIMYSNEYFINLINSYIKSDIGQNSAYANMTPQDIYDGWLSEFNGVNPRFQQVATTQKTTTGTDEQGQETKTVTTGVTEVALPTEPLQGTLVDPASEQWVSVSNSIRNQEFEHFMTPEGTNLWVDPAKNLWGVKTINGTPQLMSYGAMAKGPTEGNITQYTIGGHTWLNEPGSALPWKPLGTQPAAAMAGGGILPVQSTLGTMSPTKQWETLRAQEMGEDIWNPVQWGTRMQGFKPAYGQFLLSGQQFASPFYEFAQSGAQPDMGQGWQELVQASAGLTSPLDFLSPDQMALGRQIGYQGLLQGDAGRTNAILMASAAMGAGQGVGAEALRGQVGSLYDVFEAEAAATGQPVGGFIDWLNQRITPGSMPGTTAPLVGMEAWGK